MKRGALLFLALLTLMTGTVMAQNKTTLLIQCNQTGAQVFLNDSLVGYTTPNFSLGVSPGRYDVRVRMEGVPDFKTTVNVGSSPVTIVVNLGQSNPPLPPPPPPLPPPPPPAPTRFYLSVSSNAPNSLVYINGSFVGNAPFRALVNTGTYAVVVRATGYYEFRQNVIVNGTVNIAASLYPLGYEISIDTNGLRGAQVYKNSTWVGTTPYHDTWESDSYTVTIKAPGFNDYVESFSLGSPRTIRASLLPSTVPYEIRMPDSFGGNKDNKDNKDNKKGNRWMDFRIRIDGNTVNSFYGDISPGRHTLTLEIGDFTFDSSFVVQAGRACVIEPSFTVVVTP